MAAHQFTAKMQSALAHYAADESRNKVVAYRHAYNCENMLDSTINTKAWELFEHPLMAQAVSQMKAVAAASVAIDATWVLKRAALLADFNIRRFLKRVKGRMYYDFENATDDDWYCISELTMEDNFLEANNNDDGGVDLIPVSTIKLKGERKQAALKMVGDHVNVQAFKQQVELSGAVAVAQMSIDEFKQARKEMLSNDDC